MKFVFWMVLIVIVVMALRAKGARARAQAEQAMRRQAAAHGAAHGGEAQTMVSCAQCGLYIPAPEAVSAGGADFCCEQHRRQYQA
jgi:uncharacterized protein